jgi:hypothetical protein
MSAVTHKRPNRGQVANDEKGHEQTFGIEQSVGRSA